MREPTKRRRRTHAKQICEGTSRRYHAIHQPLVQLDLLHSLPTFNTKKYSSQDYFTAFENTALQKMSVKQFSLLEKTHGRTCPSPEQLMKCCRKSPSETMTTFVNDALAAQFAIIPRNVRAQIKKSSIVIIDFHKDCYYGTEDNPYVKKGKTKKSTTLFYEYITADIYCSKGLFTIAFFIRLPGASISELAIRLMEQVEKSIDPRVVLFDGEFATIDFLSYLTNKGVQFLGRKSKTQRVQEHVDTYYTGEQWYTQRKWRPIQLRSKTSKKKSVDADICVQEVHGEKKMLVKTIGWDITPQYADKLYGKRFGIETGYRDKHKYQIFTCTKILSTRLLFFLMAMLIWNCWQCFRIWVKSLKSYSITLPRDTLLRLTLTWSKIELIDTFFTPQIHVNKGGD